MKPQPPENMRVVTAEELKNKIGNKFKLNFNLKSFAKNTSRTLKIKAKRKPANTRPALPKFA